MVYPRKMLKLKLRGNQKRVNNMATLEQIIVETRSLSAAEKRELREVLDRELEQTRPGQASKA
jgi:hypothetical protein